MRRKRAHVILPQDLLAEVDRLRAENEARLKPLMVTLLLDTTFLIDVLNDRRGRADLMERLIGEYTLACCPINVAEVSAGLRASEAQKTETLLRQLAYVPICWEAAQPPKKKVQNGHRIKRAARRHKVVRFCSAARICALCTRWQLESDWARKGQTLTLTDTTIAAVCLTESLTLATDNRKHFPMPELALYRLPEASE